VNKSLIGTFVGGVAATALMLAAPLANAGGSVNWSVNVGVPGVVYPAYAAPVYSQPQVVYEQPQTYYYSQPAPVYYPAPRVFVAPAPLYAPVYYNGYYGHPRYWDHGGRDRYERHEGHHGR
jgi:hypothetical protein